MLHQMVPKATVIAALVNPTDPALAGPATKDAQAAGHTLGLQTHIIQASRPRRGYSNRLDRALCELHPLLATQQPAAGRARARADARQRASQCDLCSGLQNPHSQIRFEPATDSSDSREQVGPPVTVETSAGTYENARR